MQANTNNVAEASLEVTIIRADGTVEHLGVIDSYKRPWWRTLVSKTQRKATDGDSNH